MKASDSLGFNVWCQHPTLMHGDHAHGDLELNIMIRGSVNYFHGGRFVELKPERLAVFWAALPHQLVDASDNALMALAT
ncbi:MAG: AraC family ligand binding domain-containing protein, partial [Planctomycetota bacterium]|nr:AraC family ligand binding domain-containing protein [Planctomycetota bacterium]